MVSSVSGSGPHIEAYSTNSDGRPLGYGLSSRWGFSNYVVPEGGEEGGPPGFDPRGTAKYVRVDPLFGGFTVELGKLTQDALARAVKSANIRKPGTTLEERRERAAAALAAAAKVTGAIPVGPVGVAVTSDVGNPQQSAGLADGRPDPLSSMLPPSHSFSTFGPSYQHQSTQGPAGPPPEMMFPKTGEAVASHTAESSQFMQLPNSVETAPYAHPGTTQPVSMFPPATTPGGSLFQRRQAAQSQGAPVNSPCVGPPTIRIVFEIQDNPVTFEGYFHHVVVTDMTLVFVFDERAVGYPRVFPPMNIPQAIACEVHDPQRGPVLMVIEAPSHRFKFQEYEMCVARVLERPHQEPQ